MIREIIKPQQNSFTIDIPDGYINREVEFINLLWKQLDQKKNISRTKYPQNRFNVGAFKGDRPNIGQRKDY